MDTIALDGVADLTCPRCGVSLDGLDEKSPVAVDEEKRRIRAHVRCENPDCTAPLDIVLEVSDSDAHDVGVRIEDGHRNAAEDR